MQGSPTSCLILLFLVCCSLVLPSWSDLWQEGGVSSLHLWLTFQSWSLLLLRNIWLTDYRSIQQEYQLIWFDLKASDVSFIYCPLGGSRRMKIDFTVAATLVKSLEQKMWITREWNYNFTQAKLLFLTLNKVPCSVQAPRRPLKSIFYRIDVSIIDH